MTENKINKSVLLFSHEFPPVGGGAGVVALKHCIELDSLGYNVTLLTKYNSDECSYLPSNVQCIKVKYLPRIFQVFYFIEISKMKSYDIIILNDMTSIYIAGMFFSDKMLSNCMVYLHGSEPEKIFYKSSLYFKLVNYKKYYLRALALSYRIVSVSKYMKEKIRPILDGECNGKIVVNYSDVNDCFKTDLSKKNHTTKIKLLTVSRVEINKGFEDMYNIFLKVLKKEPNYIWTIVGDGEYLDVLKNKAINDNVVDNIQFTGKLSPQEIASIYEQNDLFWLLSKCKESFGLVYLESQWKGCPVLGMNKYGVKESVSDDYGFLIDEIEYSENVILAKKYLTYDRQEVRRFARNIPVGIKNVIKR